MTDQTQSTNTESVQNIVFPNGISGHLLRVTFAGPPAAIAEMEVLGHLSAQ